MRHDASRGCRAAPWLCRGDCTAFKLGDDCARHSRDRAPLRGFAIGGASIRLTEEKRRSTGIARSITFLTLETLLDAGGKHQGSAAGFGDHLVEQGLHLVDGEALPGVSGDDLGKRPRLRQFRGVGHRRDQKREPSRDQGKREMLEPMRGAL